LLFKDKSTGKADRWFWTFNNGITSDQQSPPAQYYPNTGRETEYRTGLKIFDQAGCADSAYKTIKVLASCHVAVPSAFTPNHDGLNDYLYPLNASNALDLKFRIYNRWGQLVFATSDWQKKWDGTIRGVAQTAGIYVWILQFINPDTGEKVEMKGTTMLIR
ncbi:MAG: type sorting protein, partial [Chitinophagaceae bacterium]|nr:type sorting protein [Chitinophagaceae bacterium]